MWTIEQIHHGEEFAVAAGVSLSGVVWITKIALYDILDAVYDLKIKHRKRIEETGTGNGDSRHKRGKDLQRHGGGD